MHGTLDQVPAGTKQLAALAAEINTEHALAEASSVQHAIRCGELLLVVQRAVPYGQWGTWLRQNVKFSARTARLYMQLAALSPAERQRVAEVPLRRTLQSLNKSLPSIEYITPPKYIAAARRVFGGEIDLDPASCPEAQEIVQARRYYTATEDGLSRPWCGRVWLNPPYCGLTGRFVAKLATEYRTGNVSAAILLVYADGSKCKWFAPLWDQVLCFTDHPIKFVNGWASSPRGSVFIYFGCDRNAFAREFSEFGTVMVRFT
jgi:hypothetical protein